MGCCRKLFSGHGPGGVKSVICLSWVLPLRIITLTTLVANAGYSISRNWELPLNIKFVTILHVLICLLILLECKRSVDYHRILRNRKNGLKFTV